jgi:hypothetical protein
MDSESVQDHLDSELLLGFDPERIVYTISKLERRIEERFPGASLAKVCGRLAGIAALYAERFNDSVVLQAVDEVETLTNGLRRKIWQKIMVLDAPVRVEDP